MGDVLLKYPRQEVQSRILVERPVDTQFDLANFRSAYLDWDERASNCSKCVFQDHWHDDIRTCR